MKKTRPAAEKLKVEVNGQMVGEEFVNRRRCGTVTVLGGGCSVIVLHGEQAAMGSRKWSTASTITATDCALDSALPWPPSVRSRTTKRSVVCVSKISIFPLLMMSG